MNAFTFQPRNRFSDRVTVAQAAVEWQCLSPEHQRLVIVDAGLPLLVGVPDLHDRAKALVEAAERGKISGLVTTEDGYPLAADVMRLDFHSVNAFIQSIDAMHTPSPASETPAAKEEFLTVEQACDFLVWSRSKFSRLRGMKHIDEPHEKSPLRWSKSYLIRLKESFDDNLEDDK
jgi:hypothetical protein